MVNVSAWGITQYTLRDLRPDVEYGVMVRALSLTKEGPQSKMITGRPNNNGKSDRSKLTYTSLQPNRFFRFLPGIKTVKKKKYN